MADASCSSSNPFKGLARHIEQDRSHQQDRVTMAPQHPAQGFRSQRFTSETSNQFDAFQQQGANLPASPAEFGALPTPLFNPAQAPAAFHLQPAQQVVGTSSDTRNHWVNEFQRMSLSPAHATPVHPQHAYQGPNMGQPSSVNSLYFNTFPQPPVFQPFQSFHPFQPSPVGHYLTGPGFDTLEASANRQVPQFIDNASAALNAQAELEQEFEDAMNEWMRENGPAAEMSAQSQLQAEKNENLLATLDAAEADNNDDLTASLNAAEAESTAQETAEEKKPDPETSDAELARVAQQLVDCFAENQSDKFKNSEFLAVMRRIASRQLTVQGNDLVEASPQPSSL